MPDISSMTLLDGKTYNLKDGAAEKTANKVTSVTSASTDVQYPSAKAVWELFESGLPTSVSMTIPSTGWQNDMDDLEEEDEEAETSDYPYYYDFAVSGITADDRAEVTVAANSIGTAATCGLCPTNETIAGYIRIRSASVPEEAITAVALIQ